MTLTAHFRSSSSDAVYEASVEGCSCPGYTYRGTCLHHEAILRWIDFGLTQPPAELLGPPARWVTSAAPNQEEPA